VIIDNRYYQILIKFDWQERTNKMTNRDTNKLTGKLYEMDYQTARDESIRI
jgi:hypothetical protein